MMIRQKREIERVLLDRNGRRMAEIGYKVISRTFNCTASAVWKIAQEVGVTGTDPHARRRLVFMVKCQNAMLALRESHT